MTTGKVPLACTVIVALCLSLPCGCAPSKTSGRFASDTAKRGQMYNTPEEALTALRSAFDSGDPERLVEVYGEAGRDIIVTGDKTADRAFMRRMSNRFDQRLDLLEVESDDFSNEQ